MLRERKWPVRVAIPFLVLVIAFQGFTQQEPLKADFDGNAKVDFDDFFLFAEAFGSRAGESKFGAKFDLDNSGAIDLEDFFLFADDFGKKAQGTGDAEFSLYIADQLGGDRFEGQVEIINAKENLSTGRIRVAQPRGLAFSPDGGELYVASPDSFRVFRSDGAFEFSIPLKNGFKVEISPDGRRGYVTVDVPPILGETRGVAVVDLKDRRQAGFIPLPGRPVGIAVTRDGRKAYVGNRTSRVMVLDLTQESLKDSILTINSAPSKIAISPDGQRAYLSNNIGDTINVVDTATDQVVRTFGTKPAGPHRETRLIDLAVSPDGRWVYATLLRNILALVPGSAEPVPTLIGEFLIVDPGAGTAERIEVGEVVDVMGIAPDGKTGYAVYAEQAPEVQVGVRVVDLDARLAIGSLPVAFELPVDFKFRVAR